MEALKAGGKFSAAAPFVRAAACALSGAVAVLGFAPFNWWLPTLVAFAALFFCIEKSAGVKEAFLDGWLWGLAFFTLGLSWTHRSMAVFGGFGDVLAAAGVFLMAAVLALTAAVPCAAARFSRHRRGYEVFCICRSVGCCLKLSVRMSSDSGGSRRAMRFYPRRLRAGLRRAACFSRRWRHFLPRALLRQPRSA